MNQAATTVLMIRPASFGYNAETAASNAFQSTIALSQKQIQQKALEEFDNFVQILRSKKIEVIVLEDTPQPLKPDAVFPNNWFCTLHDATIVLFPMQAANRRMEKRADLLEMLQKNYRVENVEDLSSYEADNIFLESTGSMIMDHYAKIIYACISPRTHNKVLQLFATLHGYKVTMFYSKDETGVEIYHTNVMMHIGKTYAVICLESIIDDTEKIAVSRLISTTGHEIIPITLQQVHAFAGNMLQVKNMGGEYFTILSKQAHQSLTANQISTLQSHTNLLPVNISTIETVGGGSVRCMMAEIFLQKK